MVAVAHHIRLGGDGASVGRVLCVVHFQDLWAEGGKGGKMARDSTRTGRDDSTRMNGNPLPFSMFAYIRRWVRVRLRAVPSQRHRER